MDDAGAREAVALAEKANVELRGLDAKAWLERLGAEYTTLEAALEWQLARGDTDDALRMAIALYEFWRQTGRAADGRRWFDRVLSAGSTNAISSAAAIYRKGLLAFWQGDDAAAVSSLEESLRIARDSRNPTGVAVALAGMARVALRTGDLDEARRLCVEALETVRATEDKEGRSNALHVLSVTAQMQGNLVEARDLMSQRLELARQLGSFAGVATEAGNLSSVERRLGNVERARELAAESLEIAARRGDVWMLPYALNAVAACSVDARRFRHAAELLGAAQRMVDAQGAEWPPDEVIVFEQSKAAVREALGADEFEKAWSAGQARDQAEVVRFALNV